MMKGRLGYAGVSDNNKSVAGVARGLYFILALSKSGCSETHTKVHNAKAKQVALYWRSGCSALVVRLANCLCNNMAFP